MSPQAVDDSFLRSSYKVTYRVIDQSDGAARTSTRVEYQLGDDLRRTDEWSHDSPEYISINLNKGMDTYFCMSAPEYEPVCYRFDVDEFVAYGEKLAAEPAATGSETRTLLVADTDGPVSSSEFERVVLGEPALCRVTVHEEFESEYCLNNRGIIVRDSHASEHYSSLSEAIAISNEVSLADFDLPHALVDVETFLETMQMDPRRQDARN